MKANKLVLITSSVLISMLGFTAQAKDEAKVRVQIAPGLNSVDVVHEGQKFSIKRNQDKAHTLPKMFIKTSRSCPPFCIQPSSIDPSVETVAELDVLKYLQDSSAGDKSVLVIDSRTPDWVMRGTIPGSVNIPWTKLNVAGDGAWDEAEDAPTANDVMVNQFGVKADGDKLDFTHAKTLVMFCNGSWCPQSSVNIKSLLKKGYPGAKIKWYRGGMQSWATLGLSVVSFRKEKNPN